MIVRDLPGASQAEVLATLTEIAAALTKFALKGLLGRKLRTALTAFAIVLGVAMVSGTFVLTDSIDKAFDSIFTESRAGSTAVITGKSAFDLSERQRRIGAAVSTSRCSRRCASVPGVAAAEGSVDGEAQLIGDNGKAIVYGGAPNLGFSIANGDSAFNPLTLVEGEWPGPNEVVIDKSTVGQGELQGRRRRSASRATGRCSAFASPGIVKFGSVSTIGGATLAGFDLPTAQRIFDKEGKLDEIARRREAGRLRDAARRATSGRSCRRTARSGSAPSRRRRTPRTRTSSSPSSGRSCSRSPAIALFVGSFVIANSLSITIAQRTREFATLRTLGASRRQVLRSIVVESLVVGALASIVGLFLGLGLAKGSSGSSTPSASRSRTSGLLLRDADDRRRRCSSASSSRSLASLRPAFGRRACRRSRPCARARRCPSPASRASARRARSR